MDRDFWQAAVACGAGSVRFVVVVVVVQSRIDPEFGLWSLDTTYWWKHVP